MVVVLQKMIMTGAMCVIAPGSSLQLLAAVLVTLLYMLLVLKTAPYEEDSEDYTSFIACLTLTLTTVGGFALITDNLNTPTYKSTLLGGLLVGMAVSCIVVEIGIVVLFDCGMYEKIHNRIKDGKKSESGGGNNNKTQVLPIGNDTTNDTTVRVVNVQELREIRLQHGAGSKEYIEAAQGVSGGSQE